MALPELVPQDVFIKKTHELSRLLKLVEQGSEDAVELIIGTMNSTDPEVSVKMKVECAAKLLEIQIKVSETISKDQLTRQIAAIKAKGLSTPLELAPGEKRQLPPRLDMRTIQSVD